MNRTVFVAFCWFVVWTSAGGAVGKLLEIYGGGVSGSVYGFSSRAYDDVCMALDFARLYLEPDGPVGWWMDSEGDR
jgi:hypothetical protein